MAIIFCPQLKTFVSRDVDMLKKFYSKVDVKVSNPGTIFTVVKSLFSSFFYSLVNIYKYNLVCSWFVGYHNFFPFLFARIYGVKTVSFLGGTECHHFPEFDHGNYRKKMYGWFTKATLKWSDYIFPVHETLISTKINYTNVIYENQGILAFNKKLNGVIEPLHCGFEEPNVGIMIKKISNSFLTAAGRLYGSVYERKGVDLFVKLAEALPEFSFTLVGDGYQGPNLLNLKVIKSVPYEELIQLYQSHEYYVQFSIAEGFPNALAEGMLYGCIPFGSSAFGIPDIIGKTGFILLRKDLDKAIELIRTATKLPIERKKLLSDAAVQKIKSEYSFENRRVKFKKILGI